MNLILNPSGLFGSTQLQQTPVAQQLPPCSTSIDAEAGNSSGSGVELARRTSSSAASHAAAPGQQELFVDSIRSSGGGITSAVAAAVSGAARTVAGAPLSNAGAEAASGPHLRTVVVVATLSVWLWGRQWSWWCPQLTMFPLVCLCTAASSALWCTSQELILTLGPIPVCIFRRRFPYQDILSISVVEGRLDMLRAYFYAGLRFWEIFNFIYGLTIGKSLIDVVLEPDSQSRKTLGRAGHHLLVSVDSAEDIVALVSFRKQHGPEATLPPSLAALRPAAMAAAKRKWVWCDILDPVCQPWQADDKTVCSLWDLLLQPWRLHSTPMWRPEHERTV